ncbi:MAG: leucine-rich repeat protein [Bacilli bacterium]|nr:leucine-rich repeat protein [Bacilli bacterium]
MNKFLLLFASIFILHSCVESNISSIVPSSQETTIFSDITSHDISSNSTDFLPETEDNTSLDNTSTSDSITSLVESDTDTSSSNEDTNTSNSTTSPIDTEPDDNLLDNIDFSFDYLPESHSFRILGYTPEDDEAKQIILPSLHRSCPVTSISSFFGGGISSSAQKSVKSVFIPASITNDTSYFQWLNTFDYLESIEIEESNPEYTYANECIYDKNLHRLIWVSPFRKNPILYIPESVEVIEKTALSSKLPIEEVRVDKYNAFFSSEDGVLFDKDKEKLIFYPPEKKEETYAIPQGVKELGKPGFQENKYIKNITISNGFSTFTGTFNDCVSLSKITIPEGVKEIGEIFNGCIHLEPFKLPDSLESLTVSYSSCFRQVSIPKNVLKIIVLNSHFTENYQVDEENKNFQSRDGVLYNKDLSQLISVPKHKKGELIIPKQTSSVLPRMDRDKSPNELTSISLEEGNENLYTYDGVLYPKEKTFAYLLPGTREELTLLSYPRADLGYYSNLKKVHLGKDVTDTIQGPMSICMNSIEEITCSPENENLKVIDGFLYDKEGTTLILCPSALKHITVPSFVKKIFSTPFPRHMETLRMESNISIMKVPSTNVSSVQLPAIRDYEYPDLKQVIIGKDCSGQFWPPMHMDMSSSYIESIIVDSENPYYCSEDGVLYDKDKTSLLWYPSQKEGEFKIAPSVTTIESYSVCPLKMSELLIPDHVQTIRSEAICKGPFFKKVVIPDSVTTLENYSIVASRIKHLYFGKNIRKLKLPNLCYNYYPSIVYFANKEEEMEILTNGYNTVLSRLLFETPYPNL